MDPRMILCYMYVFCKSEPLSFAFSHYSSSEQWIGLFGKKVLLISDSNEFLEKYLVKDETSN